MSQVRQHSIQAITLMLVSVFFMSTMDVVIKILVEHYSSFQVVFLRCAMSFPLFAGWITYGALMGLIGMVAYSFTTLLLRRLGSRGGTATIAFWFITIVGLIAGAFAIPEWKAISPEHWVPLLVLGVSGAGGQVLLTAAFRRSSAAIVAPLDYTHLIWAVVYGVTIWGYLPGWRVWIGAAVIILSGIFIIYRENRLRLRMLRESCVP